MLKKIFTLLVLGLMIQLPQAVAQDDDGYEYAPATETIEEVGTNDAANVLEDDSEINIAPTSEE